MALRPALSRPLPPLDRRSSDSPPALSRRLIANDDVGDGDRLHAAYVALVQCHARLPSSALKKAVKVALAEPLGQSDVADAIVAAVAAGESTG